MHRTPSRRPASAAARWRWLVTTIALCGCATEQSRRHDALAVQLERSAPRPDDRRAVSALSSAATLDRRALVRAVIARNPTLAAARQGWRAALARHPQATAFDDPRLEYALAPLSIANANVSFGQVVRLSQRFPWPGKLSLAGEVALAEAEAARANYRAVRLSLALMASMLFDRYYAAGRALELNVEHRQLANEIKRAAEAHYAAGHGSQQQVLQAEIELAHVTHQRIVLLARRSVIVARLNGLLHRPPERELPPPPERSDADLEDIASSAQLQAEALEHRPRLQLAKARLRARKAAIRLAKLQYFPDLGAMASYNSMWNDVAHQIMFGIALDLPVQLGTRRGAVQEAEARAQQVEAQLASQADEIRVEVERARQRLHEAQHVVRIYRERLVPAARAQIEAAQIRYRTGRGGFQALIDAERSLRTLELGRERALAELGERRAQLERALGHVPGLRRQRGSR